MGGRQKTKRCERLFKGVSTLINVYNVDVTANFKLYLGERLRAIMHLCTYSPLNRRLQCFVFRGKVPTFRKTFNVFNASVFPTLFLLLPSLSWFFGSFVSWMCFSGQISEDRKCFNFVRGLGKPIGVPPQ